MDKGLFRDKMVGCFEINVATIYSAEEHSLKNQWVALNNPDSDDMSIIRAYVQISVNVQGPGDSSVRLEPAGSEEDPEKKVLMPSSLSKAYK